MWEYTGEGTAFEHQHLSSSALLGRRAEDAHGQPDVVRDRGQREPGANGGSGNDVVAAGVTDLRQRVVLRAHGDDELTRARA
jgi:hypothetical protein